MTGTALPQDDHAPATRAAEAARGVISTFGGRLAGAPGTHLGVACYPRPGPRHRAWNYWWQAHYLDAIVDAALRHRRSGDDAGAHADLALGRRLLRTVWLRNRCRFTNPYFDDMAWLVLAAGRLDRLADDLLATPGHMAGLAARRLTAQLRAAATDDLDGGLFWTTARDRKNVPATGPAALHFARTGEVERARELIEWIYTRLYDDVSGLVLDSAFVDGRIDRTVYSYNQGVLLGALLSVGDAPSLARAAELVAAVGAQLRTDDAARPVLRTHGDGDGGLFTGILVRYLALAATDERLPGPTRRTAVDLVKGTADAFWSGSELRWLGGATRVFSPDPAYPAAQARPAGTVLGFTSQLQAWTTLEAAAAISP